MTEHEISSQLNYFRSLYPARRDVERGAAAKVVERFREEPKAEEDRAEEYRTEEYRAEEYISQPGQCPHDPPCEVGIGCYFIPSEEAKQEAIGRDLDAAWGPAE